MDDPFRYKKKLKIENNNNNIEKLFFSVFRNKYIKNLIFTSLKSEFRNGIYRYEEIVRVGWMIKNGYTELLKCKVIRGEQLIFSSNSPEDGPQTYYDSKLRGDFDNTYLPINLSRDKLDVKKFKKKRVYYKSSIFNVFKDDEEFFKNLFKNYKLYFQLPEQNQKNQEKEINDDDNDDDDGIKNKKLKSLREIKYLSLVYDNVASIKVINEYYYYSNGKKLSFNFFKNAIAIGSLKVAQYIFNQLFKSNDEITESQLNSIWSETVFVPENIYFTKDNNNFNEKIEFLIEEIKIPQFINETPNESLNSKNTKLCIQLYAFSYPLSLIIGLCKTILLLNILNNDSYKSKLESILNDNNSNNNNNKNNNPFTLSLKNDQMKNNQNQVIKYINEIKSFKSFKNLDELNKISKSFTEQELSTKIGEFKSNDKRVKKIYEMAIIHIFKKESIIENFLFHKFKYNSKMISNEDLKSQPSSCLHPNMFGIFYLEKISSPFAFISSDYKNHEKIQIEKFSSFAKIDYKNPFEKVQIGKFPDSKFCFVKNQKELIHQYYKDAIEQIPAHFSGNIKIDLIKEVILSDDIELVKMVFESLHPLNFNTSVIESIKSPLMFDYIKNQLEKLSKPTENSLCFDQIISNYKIANHFKNYYYQQYSLFSGQENISISKCDINFMIENFNDFKNNINLNTYIGQQFTRKSNEEIQVSTLNKLIDCIENSKIESLRYICPKVECHYHVLKNYPHKIKTDDNEGLFTCYYLNGQFDKMKEMIFSENGCVRFVEIYTIFEIVKRNDISTIEFLINSRQQLQQQNDQTQQTRPKELFIELIRALKNAARIYGNLNILKNLKDYFETMDFEGDFYISFQYGYIDIIDFIIKDLKFEPNLSRFEETLKNQSSSNNYTLTSYFEKVFGKEPNQIGFSILK
ncbi:hypothetical protein DDB_G0285173 [Dictyostelium discoideum AX4]|uniref:Uncharacterized protein n=1 Tax=Dictyostelium discoideum TaxID=44689 RepID=Q54NL5_DICDI|nr:hypothetical protein DDB_G0285173 [Dictyostelium discoideum AX4]EAL64843.1 hypothetical protein DDB_G0285173 [Dictyostelium discoideum AX4]|eukprot:XP_638347.1 hypothetical protein DDB_G0285173 [Dictyostelium discoideum AX4]